MNEDSLHNKISILEAQNKELKEEIQNYKKNNDYKEFQTKLIYEHKQKKLLVDISKLLNNYKNFRKALEKTIKLIGEHKQVSRVYLFEDYDNGKFCRSTHEWCNIGINSEKDKMQEFDYSEIPTFKPLLKKEGVLNIDNVNKLPEELQNVLKPQNVKASLLIPMYVNGEYFGNMGFDDCVVERKWKKYEINFLRIIVNLVATAFEKAIYISQLKYSNNRFKAFSRATFEAIFICNKIKIIDLNYKARQLTKYNKTELINKNITDLIEKSKNEFFLFALNSSKEQIGEFKLIRKDKTKIDVEIETKYFYYNDERVIIVAIRDITERKKSERLIKENQDKYRAIIETAKDAIFIFEKTTGKIHDLNKNAEKLVKISKKKLLNKNRKIIHPKHELEDITGRFIDENYWTNNIIRTFVIDANNKYIPVEISSNKITINKIEFIIGFYRDVSSQVEHEKMLLHAKNKAEESERLKSAFLSNISHEIRTPLNGILGFTDLLKEIDADDDDKRLRFLGIIEDSGNQLLKLINDLIDLSKLETENIKLDFENICIKNLFIELQEFFEHGILSKSKNKINLYYEIDNNKSNEIIYTDYLRLKQILINLINNAVKFTEKGYVKFGFEIKKYNNIKYIEFYVTDTGIGISNEFQKIIFQRFRQEDESTSKKYGGTGLGLNISKILTEKFGGKIWLKSEINKGSTFYFTVPFIKQ